MLINHKLKEDELSENFLNTTRKTGKIMARGLLGTTALMLTIPDSVAGSISRTLLHRGKGESVIKSISVGFSKGLISSLSKEKKMGEAFRQISFDNYTIPIIVPSSLKPELKYLIAQAQHNRAVASLTMFMQNAIEDNSRDSVFNNDQLKLKIRTLLTEAAIDLEDYEDESPGREKTSYIKNGWKVTLHGKQGTGDSKIGYKLELKQLKAAMREISDELFKTRRQLDRSQAYIDKMTKDHDAEIKQRFTPEEIKRHVDALKAEHRERENALKERIRIINHLQSEVDRAKDTTIQSLQQQVIDAQASTQQFIDEFNAKQQAMMNSPLINYSNFEVNKERLVPDAQAKGKVELHNDMNIDKMVVKKVFQSPFKFITISLTVPTVNADGVHVSKELSYKIGVKYNIYAIDDEYLVESLREIDKQSSFFKRAINFMRGDTSYFGLVFGRNAVGLKGSLAKAMAVDWLALTRKYKYGSSLVINPNIVESLKSMYNIDVRDPKTLKMILENTGVLDLYIVDETRKIIEVSDPYSLSFNDYPLSQIYKDEKDMRNFRIDVMQQEDKGGF